MKETIKLRSPERDERYMVLLCMLLFLILMMVQGLGWSAQPQSDLAIAVSANNTLPQLNGQIVYTLTVTNNGPADASAIQITDVLPANVTYVSDTSGGSYANLTGLWTLNPPKLSANSSLSIDITVMVVTLPVAGNSFTNTATITNSNHPDPNTSNNSSSVIVTVAGANLTMLKSALTTADPVNGTSSPYNIPGATVLYSLQTTNTGQGAADTDTVIVTDPIPPNADLYVGDLGGVGSGPVLFIDGGSPTSSGLTYTYSGLSSSTDDLEFSSDNGATWTYTPIPDASGYDAKVTNIRVNPKGVMSASSGTTNPSFILRFQVRLQ